MQSYPKSLSTLYKVKAIAALNSSKQGTADIPKKALSPLIPPQSSETMTGKMIKIAKQIKII